MRCGAPLGKIWRTIKTILGLTSKAAEVIDVAEDMARAVRATPTPRNGLHKAPVAHTPRPPPLPSPCPPVPPPPKRAK